MYEYKVLDGSFVAGNDRDFANTLEYTLNSMQQNGWEFYCQSNIDQFIAPGCLSALFGKKTETISHQTFVFRRLKKGNTDELKTKKTNDDILENKLEQSKNCKKSIINSKEENVYYNRGVVNYNLKKYEEAIKDFDSAIELEPYNANIYCCRGNAKNALEQYEEATRDFDKAMELDPNIILEEK